MNDRDIFAAAEEIGNVCCKHFNEDEVWKIGGALMVVLGALMISHNVPDKKIMGYVNDSMPGLLQILRARLADLPREGLH